MHTAETNDSTSETSTEPSTEPQSEESPPTVKESPNKNVVTHTETHTKDSTISTSVTKEVHTEPPATPSPKKPDRKEHSPVPAQQPSDSSSQNNPAVTEEPIKQSPVITKAVMKQKLEPDKKLVSLDDEQKSFNEWQQLFTEKRVDSQKRSLEHVSKRNSLLSELAQVNITWLVFL